MQYFDSQLLVINSVLNISEDFSVLYYFIQMLELSRWIILISCVNESLFYI